MPIISTNELIPTELKNLNLKRIKNFILELNIFVKFFKNKNFFSIENANFKIYI